MNGLLARLRLPTWLQPRAGNAEGVIRASGLFDDAWYLETYPDVAARKVDPPGGRLSDLVRDRRILE